VWSGDSNLSIFWLEMTGNSFNLYASTYYVDNLPFPRHKGRPGCAADCPSVCTAGLIGTAVHSGLYTLVREAGHFAW
jgi:hypothetical protein